MNNLFDTDVQLQKTERFRLLPDWLSPASWMRSA